MKKLIIAIVMLCMVLPVFYLSAQTAPLNFIAYEGQGGVSTLFVSLNGDTDTDTSSFVDWSPISGATSINYWGQTMDSLNANTTDTVKVLIFGTASSGSAPLILDTITVIGGQAGVLSISATSMPPYVGFRAITTATVAKHWRKLIFKLNAVYNSGIDAEVIRQRVANGTYGR